MIPYHQFLETTKIGYDAKYQFSFKTFIDHCAKYHLKSIDHNHSTIKYLLILHIIQQTNQFIKKDNKKNKYDYIQYKYTKLWTHITAFQQRKP